MSYHIQKNTKTIPVNDAEYGDYIEIESFNPFNTIQRDDDTYDKIIRKSEFKSLNKDYSTYQVSKSLGGKKLTRVF